MKHLLLFLLILSPFISIAQSWDYWVIRKGSVVLYDSRKDDSDVHALRYGKIELGREMLSLQDSVIVEYHNDTACPECIYNLMVTVNKSDVVLKYTKIGEDVFKIGITDLLSINKSRQFDFYYYREDKPSAKRLCNFAIKG